MRSLKFYYFILFYYFCQERILLVACDCINLTWRWWEWSLLVLGDPIPMSMWGQDSAVGHLWWRINSFLLTKSIRIEILFHSQNNRTTRACLFGDKIIGRCCQAHSDRPKVFSTVRIKKRTLPWKKLFSIRIIDCWDGRSGSMRLVGSLGLSGIVVKELLVERLIIQELYEGTEFLSCFCLCMGLHKG